MTLYRSALFLLGALLLAACEQDTAKPTPAPPPAAGNGPVVITLSDSAPAKGSVLTIHAQVRAGAGTAASYVARLLYDRAGLVYLRDLTASDGLHAINPQPGLVRIAGASTAGFRDGHIFALEFRVNDPAALRSLELRLEELNGPDFRTALPRVALDRVVHFVPEPR
jgi:hypothetical protein